ncbi:unnamed protein product [Ascophyllum nodosum]
MTFKIRSERRMIPLVMVCLYVGSNRAFVSSGVHGAGGRRRWKEPHAVLPPVTNSPQLQLVSSPSSCALLHQRRRRAPQPLNAATSPPSAPFGQTRDADVAPGESRESRESGSTRKKRPLLLGWIKRTVPKVASFLTVMITFHLFRFLLRRLNKVECRNQEKLVEAVLNRGDRGLLTVSNHMSVYDDPGLWAALIPFWRTGAKKMRWAMCTDDIYNASPLLKKILIAGKTLPIKRSRGMEQPLFKVFFQKLEKGHWGHIFAEGSIRQPWRFSRGEPILADFKAGIGRLLLRSENPPMVLPIYHIGMHQVAPETPVLKGGRGKLVKKLPNIGRKILVYVGDPIDVGPVVRKCRERMGDVRHLPWTKRSSRAEIECHQEIAAFVRDHVLKLEEIARRDYYGREPEISPYAVAE